jgi:inositol transporter-like SP family MFS transporter
MSNSNKQHWKWTIAASMANYMDSGSIIAIAISLAIWAQYFHLNTSLLGLIGAIGPNAFAGAIGALIGGRLCDMLGRKKIYAYDLLFYAFGMLFFIFATAPWMILVGSIIVGLAVGADIPASWTIISEQAPDESRGKHNGFAQLLWGAGILIVPLIAFFLTPLGLLGIRIVFAHLFIIALITWALRRGMVESEIWKKASQEEANTSKKSGSGTNQFSTGSVQKLFSKQNLGALIFLVSMYGIWNLNAGSQGAFMPYILSTIGGFGQATIVIYTSFIGVLGLLGAIFIYLPLIDRVNRRVAFGISACLQVIALLIYVFFPLNTVTVIANCIFMSVGGAFSAQPLFQLWSSELFPTLLRSSAQGLSFAFVRIGLAIWSLFVPTIALLNFHILALILASFVLISGLIGFIWAPDTKGKSLEEIQSERKNKWENSIKSKQASSNL